jgi:signal transduction histidine kinase
MSDRTARRMAFGLWTLAVLSTLVWIPLGIADRSIEPIGVTGIVAAVIGLIWVSVGALIAARRHGNAVGWLFCAIGLGIAVTQLGSAYTVYGLKVNTSAPGVPVAALVGEYGLFAVATLGLLFLLFPDGRVPGPRWRWVGWAILGGAGLALVGSLLKPETLNNYRDLGINYRNPTGVQALAHVAPWVITVGTMTAVIGSLAAVVGLRYRYRRSTGEVRQQIRWLAYVGGLAFVLFIAWALFGVILPGPTPENAFDVLLAAVAITIALGVPAAVTVSVFKYRLYDIDVVINKTLVYAALAAFITAIYVGIVVGIGALIGQGTSKPNLGLSILATGVVAVAFQPVRERVQRFANRLVYGKRATPYEVLSEFSHRMAGTYAADDVLPRMARILAEGTGAKEARVWLGVSGNLTPAASWPDTSTNGSASRPDGADLLVPVTHQGDELGALSISKAPGERLTPAEEKLTRDLASQAGLVLRNVKLIEDLKASRVRLVQAQDSERRRIERNIHDGAQQQLVALQVKLGLARRMASDPESLDRVLTQLQEETNQALQDLRDLARGIYPPLLADQGLVAALQAQARRSLVPVTVESDGIARYAQDVEAAVYFCALEALQNVAKYAGATKVSIVLSASNGDLTFSVTDDGRGFDPSTTSYGTGLQGMADRLTALGGTVEIRSKPGEGTAVVGSIAARQREPAA